MAYKRSIYLVNPKFQLSLSLKICLLVFISSLIYPFTIYELLSGFIKFAMEKSPELATQMKAKRESLIFILSLWQIGFTALVFIICIFVSHKIAGPVYKLQKFLQSYREGNSLGQLQFRNGDYFPELAEEYNDTIEFINETHQSDAVYLSEVSSYIKNLTLVVPEDKKVVIEEINNKIGEMLARFDKGHQ